MQEKLPDLRDAFGALARALQRIAVQRQARGHLPILQPALQALSSLVMREDSVTVQLEASSLSFNGEAVYSEVARESSLCFRLHRDGVRSLTFNRGLSVEDLLAFVQVALPDEEKGPRREDAVTGLWKADLRSISYTAVAGYGMEQDGEAISQAAERARGSLQRFAGGLSQQEETAVRLAPPLLTEVERRQLDGESWSALAQRVAGRLLDIVSSNYAGRDLAALEETYGRLVDEILERADLEALALAVSQPQALAGPQAAAFRAVHGQRLAEPARLRRILELSRRKVECAARVLPAWLSQLPAGAGDALLGALEAEEAPALRAPLAQAVVRRLAGCRKACEQKLRAGPPELVRALLAALELLPPAQRAALAGCALQHKSVPVRIEALAGVGSDPAVAIAHLGHVLSDRDQPVRIAAAEALGGCAAMADEAARLLLATIDHEQFALTDRTEQVAFHRALGRLRSTAGFAFLQDRLAGPRSRRRPEEQLFAAQGLTADGTERSLAALEEAAEAANPAPVVAACKVAAQRVRQQLSRERP